MRRICLKLAVIVVLAIPLIAVTEKPKDSPLHRRLESELMGKSFEVKIRLGSYWSYYNQKTGKQCYRLIDTEFVPNGGVRYQARRGCYSEAGQQEDFIAGNVYVDPGKITRDVAPGVRIRVIKVDMMDDRIELLLQRTDGKSVIDSYAKIKFMLGKGYLQSDPETVLKLISQTLRIESFERIDSLTVEFADLQNQLKGAEATYAAIVSANAGERLEAAKRVRATLQRITSNRSAYISAGGSDPDAGTYMERAGLLDGEIAKLETEVKKEKVNAARAALEANVTAAAQKKAALGQPVASLPEWERKSQTLTDYRRLLDERQSLFSQLQTVGEPASTDDVEKMKEEVRYSESLNASLISERQKLQLVQINADYGNMERKRSQLLDAYTRAFGSAKERPALQELIGHLERMVGNRAEAERLGDATAATQISRLRTEVEKLKKR